MCLSTLQLIITGLKCNHTFEMITYFCITLLVINIRVPFFLFFKINLWKPMLAACDLLSDGCVKSNVYLLRDISLLNFSYGFKSPCFLHRHSVKKEKGEESLNIDG